jgi:hypothetical protein
MNEKTQKDVLAHLQAKFDALPAGTVLVPPTNDDDDSDVRDVEFGDPKLMSRANDTDADVIEEFIRNYPYQEFTYICRRLKMKPAECLERVLAFNEEGNGWYSAAQETESLKADAAKLIEEGWEPGTPPPTPMTKAEVFTLLHAILKVKLDMDSNWSIYDMIHRTGLETEELAKYVVDYTVTHVLSTFKYMGEQKWMLSPDQIEEAAAHCEWTRTGADSVYTEINEKREELRKKLEAQKTPEQREKRVRWYIDYFPTEADIKELHEEQMRYKYPVVPYVDYCSSCGMYFTGDEMVCACGALRMYQPPEPPKKGEEEIEQ